VKLRTWDELLETAERFAQAPAVATHSSEP
jgi:hypothetical protein